MSGSNKEHILVSAFLSLDHGEWNDLCAIKKNDFGTNNFSNHLCLIGGF